MHDPYRGKYPRLAIAVLLGLTVAQAKAQGTSTQDQIERYREMLKDGNPADVIAIKGESLWKQKRGPKQASLEACDLGKGPGVVAGAYAELPRYFADTQRVMDFESRLVHCMVSLQGLDASVVTAKPFSAEGQPATDIEAITAYITDESRGAKVHVSQQHPAERAAYERGRIAFFYRGGPYDFSCATCHSEDGKRIRLQDLPNLTKPEYAQKAFATWPAYRVSQGAFRTMQWRMFDCFRQQRFPQLKYTSQTSIDLITFLGVNAKGAVMDAPGIKR